MLLCRGVQRRISLEILLTTLNRLLTWNVSISGGRIRANFAKVRYDCYNGFKIFKVTTMRVSLGRTPPVSTWIPSFHRQRRDAATFLVTRLTSLPLRKYGGVQIRIAIKSSYCTQLSQGVRASKEMAFCFF